MSRLLIFGNMFDYFYRRFLPLFNLNCVVAVIYPK